MPRQYNIYIDDICQAIEKIEEYTRGITYEKFVEDSMISDAVIRNLEIIGEAVKKIPNTIKLKHPEIEWRKLANLRNILIHEYFGVNLCIIWDIVRKKIPQHKQAFQRVRENSKV
ncbi:MAG: DUF86 domain-containing protein [Nanoarchaeota archaeon]